MLVLLIGHGTGGEVDEAKFNLVGPDLSADEWGSLVRPIAGRVVFVNTRERQLSVPRGDRGRGRIVLTANDSAAQQFETVFPEFFVKAFDDGDADLDKNGKVSIWEAFAYASDGVRGWFEARGQLATERPLLDERRRHRPRGRHRRARRHDRAGHLPAAGAARSPTPATAS